MISSIYGETVSYQHLDSGPTVPTTRGPVSISSRSHYWRRMSKRTNVAWYSNSGPRADSQERDFQVSSSPTHSTEGVCQRYSQPRRHPNFWVSYRFRCTSDPQPDVKIGEAWSSQPTRPGITDSRTSMEATPPVFEKQKASDAPVLTKECEFYRTPRAPRPSRRPFHRKCSQSKRDVGIGTIRRRLADQNRRYSHSSAGGINGTTRKVIASAVGVREYPKNAQQ